MNTKTDDNVQEDLLEASILSSKIKSELAQSKAHNDYLEKIVKKMEQIVLGGR